VQVISSPVRYLAVAIESVMKLHAFQ